MGPVYMSGTRACLIHTQAPERHTPWAQRLLHHHYLHLHLVVALFQLHVPTSSDMQPRLVPPTK
jgi:hypothetical protein